MNIKQESGKIIIELQSPGILNKVSIRSNIIPQRKGVYFIYNNKDELIYIGQSINIKQRMETHCHTMPNAMKISYLLVNQNEDLDVVEKFYINYYKPHYNLNPPWKITDTSEQLEFKKKYEDTFIYGLRKALDEGKGLI